MGFCRPQLITQISKHLRIKNYDITEIFWWKNYDLNFKKGLISHFQLDYFIILYFLKESVELRKLPFFLIVSLT